MSSRRWKLEDLESKMPEDVTKKMEWLATSRTYRKVSSDESQQPSDGYDSDMIRDFIDQLLFELRIQHATSAEFARILESGDIESRRSLELDHLVPAEIIDALEELLDKRCTNLLPVQQFDLENTTPREARKALYSAYYASAKWSKLRIDALEELQATIERALLCVDSTEVDENGNRFCNTVPFPARTVLDNILKKSKDNEPKGEDDSEAA